MENNTEQRSSYCKPKKERLLLKENDYFSEIFGFKVKLGPEFKKLNFTVSSIIRVITWCSHTPHTRGHEKG